MVFAIPSSTSSHHPPLLLIPRLALAIKRNSSIFLKNVRYLSNLIINKDCK